MLRTEQSTVGPRTAWGFRVLIFHAVDSLSMAPSDREAQPQTAQSLLSGLEGGLCRAVPCRLGAVGGSPKQPSHGCWRRAGRPRRPRERRVRVGAGGTLGSWCWAAPGAQVTSGCHGSPVDHKTSEDSVAPFSFLSFQLQLTFCMNSHQFLVCGTVVRHLYTLRSDPPHYSVPHPAPRMAAAVRTVFPCCASRPVAAAYGTVDFWPWDWEEFIEQKQGQKWLSSQSRCVQLCKNQGLSKHPPHSM